MTKTMSAAVFEQSGAASLKTIQIAKPELTANNAIIKVRGCGVCGSDLMKLERKLVKEGTVLGHELVGEIFEISDDMSKKYNLKVGDRIVSSHHVPCGECKFCLNEKESLCKQFKTTNFDPGAFAEYLSLSELHLKHTVMKIPNKLSDEEASFTEPLACCLKAVKKSGLPEFKGKAKVLVIGLGSIGQLIGQSCKALRKDEMELTGLDLVDAKLELAKENNFDQCLKTINDFQADFIFLCAGAAIDLAIKNASDGASIIVFSSIKDTEAGFSNNEIYFRELKIAGSYSPNLSDLKQSLELISSAEINVKNLISHRCDLENLGKTIVQSQEEQGIKTYLKF